MVRSSILKTFVISSEATFGRSARCRGLALLGRQNSRQSLADPGHCTPHRRPREQPCHPGSVSPTSSRRHPPAPRRNCPLRTQGDRSTAQGGATRVPERHGGGSRCRHRHPSPKGPRAGAPSHAQGRSIAHNRIASFVIYRRLSSIKAVISSFGGLLRRG